MNENEEVAILLPKKEVKKKVVDKSRRYMALVVVGILTGGYSIMEIVISRVLESVSLLSDGIHNLSDVISLLIAFLALMKSTSTKKDEYTYGWKRTEILGAVMNGAFLLSLALYILIEAIPKFIVNECDETEKLSQDFTFIITAAAGLGINTLGTILFCCLSGGHGHVHAGGGDHGHSHGGGHSHAKKKNKHGHSHGEKDHHDHGDADHENHLHEDEHHGHSHGEKKHKDEHGHSHGEKKHKDEHHGHSHGEKKHKDGHGHSHGEKKPKESHGHSSDEEKGDHEHHGHSHGEKKHKDGHGHSHGEKKHKEMDHMGHSHGEKKHKEEKEEHQPFMSHSAGEKKSKESQSYKDEKTHHLGYSYDKKYTESQSYKQEKSNMGHSHGEKKIKGSQKHNKQEEFDPFSNPKEIEQMGFSDDNNPHLSSPNIQRRPPSLKNLNFGLLEVTTDKYQKNGSDSDSDDHDHHDHENHTEEEKETRDMNIHAVFLHYLGDALSSVILVVTGVLIKYFPGMSWTRYLDPIASILIVILILYTTIPLLKTCSKILLQQIPETLHLPTIKGKLNTIRGVQGIHDLHVWQLVDSLVIASLHVTILKSEMNYYDIISAKIRKVFHKVGIHSITLQPEFIPDHKNGSDCEHYCIKDCEEDWCCKENQESLPLVDYNSTSK